MDDERSELRHWLAALSSDNSAERSDAAEAPPDEALDDEIVAALIPLLHDPDDLVRLCAAETLGWYPGPQTVAALRTFVAREADPLTRAYWPPLIHLVAGSGVAREADPLTRAYGLSALGRTSTA